MIFPELTRCIATDLRDPASWVPLDETEVFQNIELTFRAAGQPCGDYQLLVASSAALSQRRRDMDFSFPQMYTMISKSFVWEEIVRRIQARARDCAADSVEGVMMNLRQMFYWEYEDYELAAE